MESPPPYSAPYALASPAVPDDAARARLAAFGFPPGLIEVVLVSARTSGARYWLVDNSGSMGTPDGHVLEGAPGRERLVSCSRYAEVQDMLVFHAELAVAVGTPMHVRFLNPPRLGPSSMIVRTAADVTVLRSALSSGPSGGTPICSHVAQIGFEIARDEAQLRASGKQAVLTIVTDGKPTDGDLAHAMQPLSALPVWVVVRLCTDEQDVVDYWGNLDNVVEIELDVLDDLAGEAGECASHNGWLTYAPLLHRLREWGIHLKLFDLLDERKLAPPEARELCALILGGGQLPHPEADLAGFMEAVAERQQGLPLQYNAVRRRATPWIDERRLRAAMENRWCAVQ